MATFSSIMSAGLSNFFAGLMPNFEKRRLLEDIRSSMEELKITEEMYRGTGPENDSVIPSISPDLPGEMSKRFPRYHGDFFQTIHEVIKTGLSEKDALEDLVQEIYGDNILKDGLDYLKINILRYVQGLKAFNKFARDVAVIATLEPMKGKIKESAVDRLARDRLEDRGYVRVFVAVAFVMSHPVKDLRAAFSKVKGITFNPETDSDVRKHMGDDVVDPVKFGMVPVIGDMSYLVGRWFNEFLSYRQELAKEELEKLRIQTVLLKRRQDASTDPREIDSLQKQLDYYNNRINKLQGKLDSMVED